MVTRYVSYFITSTLEAHEAASMLVAIKICLLHFAYYAVPSLLVEGGHAETGAVLQLNLMVPHISAFPLKRECSTQAGSELQMSHGRLPHPLSGQNGQISNVHVHHRHVQKKIPHSMPPLVAPRLRGIGCTKLIGNINSTHKSSVFHMHRITHYFFPNGPIPSRHDINWNTGKSYRHCTCG
jgi:hypothetical protein